MLLCPILFHLRTRAIASRCDYLHSVGALALSDVYGRNFHAAYLRRRAACDRPPERDPVPGRSAARGNQPAGRTIYHNVVVPLSIGVWSGRGYVRFGCFVR